MSKVTPTQQQISTAATQAQGGLNKMKNGQVPTKAEFLEMVKHAAISGEDSPFTKQFMVLVQEMDNDPDAQIEKNFDKLKVQIAGMSKSEVQSFTGLVRGFLWLNPDFKAQQEEWAKIKAQAPNVGWV